MRVRTVPIAATLLAGAVAGSLALSPATVFAKSSHSNHTRKVVIKGDCNAVNGSSVQCVNVSHGHDGWGGDGYYARGGYWYYHNHRIGPIAEGLGDITEGVGDVLQGVLCAL